MTARPASFARLLALLPAFCACSADSVTAPEPELERPGSFVAATDSDGVIFLVRTLRIVPLDTESLYEAILYRGEPSSYDEAKAWAQDQNLPISDPHIILSLQTILSLEPEVVWFRTLSDSELDALR